MIWDASYKPFGAVDLATSTNPPPELIDLRYPGQWFSDESNLHQNWMRDYDPTLGRYIQADPLGLVDGASVYGYALQSPNRYVDPRGEDVFVSLTDGAAAGFGHLGIGEIVDNQPPQTHGYYPEEGAGAIACCVDVPGELKSDNMNNVTRMMRITLSDQKTKQIGACIRKRKAAPGKYNLFSRSCTDFVRDCLKEVGVLTGIGNRPDLVYENLLRSNRKYNEILNTLE